MITTAGLAAIAGGAWASSRLTQRSGSRGTTIAGLAVVLLASIIRAAVPGIPGMIVATVAVGTGIGILSTALVGAIRLTTLSPRAGSTIYTAGMVGGSILAGLLAAPLAAASGWRGAALALALPTLLGLAMFARTRHSDPPVSHHAGSRLPRGAWLLAMLFGLQAAIYQGLAQWGPDLLAEQGWSIVMAGSVVALVNVIALASNLVSSRLPLLARSSSALIIASSVLIAAGTLLTLTPTPLVGFVLTSIGLGVIFPALFAVALVVAPDPRMAAATAGLMNTVGFLIAAVTPLLLGITRDLTGTYRAPLLELVIVAIGLIVLGVGLRTRIR
jgi:CP family cyanate transporter-like MFS transporter